MLELLSEKLNVAVQIGAKYPKFGIHLLDDKTAPLWKHWRLNIIGMLNESIWPYSNDGFRERV